MYYSREGACLAEVLPNFESGAILDIGAEIGVWSMFAAARTGAQIHAFEPNPVAFEVLLANLEAAGLQSRVLATPVAVSNQSGVGPLHVHVADSYMAVTASLVHADDMQVYSIPASLTTIDEYVEASNLSDVRFIKTGSAFHEYEVLTGATLCYP